MFSLIMGASADDTTMGKDRLFEYTEPPIKTSFEADLNQLKQIPALVMPELQDRTRPQVARVGRVESISLMGRNCQYRFVPDPDIPAIPSSTIEALGSSLVIDGSQWGEFTRTHWAVKDADLYHTLLKRPYPPTSLESTVFAIPTADPDPDLVSVMMPFDAASAPIYQALLAAVTQQGWQCRRADELFTNGPVIQDIVDLIASSTVVICDLSGRNANVFYEAGIAHAIGRNVVLLARHESDVPFDLRHLRYISYVDNDQGREELTRRVLLHLAAISNSNR